MFQDLWFSKDNLTGHSERKRKKKQTEVEVGRQYQRVSGQEWTKAAENRTRLKEIVANSSVLPRRLSKVME